MLLQLFTSVVFWVLVEGVKPPLSPSYPRPEYPLNPLIPRESQHHPVYQEPPRYKYSYDVLDSYNALDFEAKESRDGYMTDGSYSVQLPDGRRQTVTYYDHGHGLVAKVTYEGRATYPPPSKYSPPVYVPKKYPTQPKYPAHVKHPYSLYHPPTSPSPKYTARPKTEPTSPPEPQTKPTYPSTPQPKPTYPTKPRTQKTYPTKAQTTRQTSPPTYATQSTTKTYHTEKVITTKPTTTLKPRQHKTTKYSKTHIKLPPHASYTPRPYKFPPPPKYPVFPHKFPQYHPYPQNFPSVPHRRPPVPFGIAPPYPPTLYKVPHSAFLYTPPPRYPYRAPPAPPKPSKPEEKPDPIITPEEEAMFDETTDFLKITTAEPHLPEASDVVTEVVDSDLAESRTVIVTETSAPEETTTLETTMDTETTTFTTDEPTTINL